MSEPIRPYSTDEEKQDCEYKGFVRLAKRIKDTFPRLGICIVGDALYACSPVIKICEQYNWDYIFTFKQGRTPAAYKEAETLMNVCPGNSGRIVCHNQHGKPYDGGSVAWASNVEIAGYYRSGIARFHKKSGSLSSVNASIESESCHSLMCPGGICPEN